MVEQIDYGGAGTLEFIYEMESFTFGNEYKVQVEPDTEVQTGIDIVKEQLWIAYSGETALKQDDIDQEDTRWECKC